MCLKKIASALLTCCLIISVSLAQKQGQERIDSLLNVFKVDSAAGKLNENVPDTNIIQLMIDLSYEYYRVNPDAGIYFGNKALILSKKINWKRGVASAGNKTGLNYWAKSNYPKALEYQMAALKLSEEINDKKSVAVILGNIGLVYEGQADYKKALVYHFDALKLNEELNEKSAVARNLGNIGNAYDAQGDYNKSLEYYFKALKMYEILGEEIGQARNLGNIGFAYQEKKEYAKAIVYHNKALSMNRALGNRILEGMNIGNIGATYMSIAQQNNLSGGKPSVDSLRNEIIIPKAEQHLKASIAIFTEINDKQSLHELYLYLSQLEEISGRYKQSLDAYRMHIACRDAVYSEENKNQIAALEKGREEDLKLKEIELLKSQNEIQRLRAQRSLVVNVGLGAALLAIVFIALSVYRQSKKIRLVNAQLQTTIAELKNTQDQLVKSERMAAFGVMASRVAHEIQNPINFVKNFSELNIELFDEMQPTFTNQQKEDAATISQNLKKVVDHAERANVIVKQLLEHTRKGSAHEFFEPEK